MKANHVIILLILAAVGIWTYNFVLGPTEEASGPIKASPIRTDSSGPSSSVRIYRLNQSASEARFRISEHLRGQPKNVVGVTNQVAGEISVNLSDISTAKVGEIRINARTLTTDNGRRDRVTQNRILKTDAHEFIVFRPTNTSGLTGSVDVGDSFQLQLTGDLTIRDITRSVVLDATVQVVSNTELRIQAITTINRGDFNLAIPNVPFVANVGETVQLEFVGTAVG